jgi:hypothetical protein
MPVPFAPPTRRTARHGSLTSPDCAPRARPGYPYARLPQSTRTAGGSIIGQATAGYRPGERAPEPPIMDVRQLAQYQADAPCRTAVTHVPGRCAAATICGVLRPCLGRRPPFVPPISTAAGQHAAGCPGLRLRVYDLGIFMAWTPAGIGSTGYAWPWTCIPGVRWRPRGHPSRRRCRLLAGADATGRSWRGRRDRRPRARRGCQAGGCSMSTRRSAWLNLSHR